MTAKISNGIVRSYFEKVSWRVLDTYRTVLIGMIRGHAGVYALYNKSGRLYYVGLASNLMGRVKQHLDDRHKGKWDRFSVYLTIDNSNIRPIEALLLRVTHPEGNRVKGKLKGAQDLVREFKRKLNAVQRDETAILLGGRFASHRRRAKARATKGTLVLAGLVERRIVLQATYKGTKYRATLRKDGYISYQRKLYESPTGVARVIVGRQINGWHFWRYRNTAGEWVKLAEIKG